MRQRIRQFARLDAHDAQKDNRTSDFEQSGEMSVKRRGFREIMLTGRHSGATLFDAFLIAYKNGQ